jgi:hypothetical protein
MNVPDSFSGKLVARILIFIGLLLMYLPLFSDILAYIPYVLFRCTGEMNTHGILMPDCRVLPFFSDKLVAAIKTWGFLIVPPVGLGLLVYCFFMKQFSRAAKILLIVAACPPVLFIIAHFFPPMGFFVVLGAILITLASPCLAVFFNFALSYVAVKNLKANRPLKIALFIAVSILFTLNVRIPGIASDLFYAATKGELSRIDRQIVLPRTEPVSLIQDVDTIEYRANPLGTYTLAADYVVHGHHIKRPAISKVRIEDHLLSKGYLVDRKGNAKTKLIVAAHDNGYTTDVTLSVVDGEAETAHYHNRLRKSYFLEKHGDLARYSTRETDSMGNQLLRFVLASFQDSAWNKIAVALLADEERNSRKPLLEFLDRAIDVDRQTLPAKNIVEAKVGKTDRVEEALPLKKLYGEYRDYHATLVSGCGGENTGTKVVMPFPDDHYLMFISEKGKRIEYFKGPIVTDNSPAYRPERVICQGDEVIVFLVPSSRINVTAVLYSLNGDCLGVYQLAMPNIELGKSKGRKVFVDFKKLPDSYEFTILEIPEGFVSRSSYSAVYQFTPSDIQNGVVDAYRVTFEK